MEFVLELILEIAELAVRESKYKSVRSRTRAITAFYGVIAAVILGFGVFLTISMLCKGDRMAAAVIGGISLLLAVLFAVGIVLGHKRNWERKDG